MLHYLVPYHSAGGRQHLVVRNLRVLLMSRPMPINAVRVQLVM